MKLVKFEGVWKEENKLRIWEGFAKEIRREYNLINKRGVADSTSRFSKDKWYGARMRQLSEHVKIALIRLPLRSLKVPFIIEYGLEAI